MLLKGMAMAAATSAAIELEKREERNRIGSGKKMQEKQVNFPFVRLKSFFLTPPFCMSCQLCLRAITQKVVILPTSSQPFPNSFFHFAAIVYRKLNRISFRIAELNDIEYIVFALVSVGLKRTNKMCRYVQMSKAFAYTSLTHSLTHSTIAEK